MPSSGIAGDSNVGGKHSDRSSAPLLRPVHRAGAPATRFCGATRGKCLHYYFYFIDEVLGLCFLAVPTWCPLRALFYFNGRNWLASKLRKAKVAFELNDNAFADVSDWQKAQDLLEQLGRYHWSIMQAEYATDIVFRRAATLVPLYDHRLRTAILWSKSPMWRPSRTFTEQAHRSPSRQ